MKKICSKCKTEKDITDFSHNSHKKDGRSYDCKDCQKQIFAERYKKNRQKCIDSSKNIINKYVEINKEYLLKIKEQGCTFCNEKNSCCLDLHHLNEDLKIDSVSKMIKGSFNYLKEEVEKCVLLCSNCHRKLHNDILVCDNSHLIKNININIDYIPEAFKLIKHTKDRSHLRKKSKKLREKKTRNKIVWPTKEILQELVWEIPTVAIAEKLGVSDKAIDKRCKKLGIDKPPRGYWAKLKKELL